MEAGLVSLLFSLGALICGATGLIIALRILRSPPNWLPALVKGVMKPGYLGNEIRTAYSSADVAGILVAVIDAEKPAIKDFAINEGIPFLAAAGSGEVAKNARGGKSKLAAAVGDLGSGAAGLQGLVAALAKPGKSSGIGDLIQYLPAIQSFMQSQKENGANPALVPQSPSSPQLPSQGGGGWQ